MTWAEWASFGLDAELFWRSTIEEVEAVLKAAGDRFGRFDMLAGLIAAQIENFSGGRMSRRSNVTWRDFFTTRPAGPPRLSEEQQKKFEGRPLMRTVRNTGRNRRLST